MGRIEIINKIAAKQTIVGPVGVSNEKESCNPPKTETVPTIIAPIAIFSGVFVNLNAVAAGITSIETIKITPITFIATATNSAKIIVKISCSFLGLMPLACARSALMVAIKSGDQRQ